MKIGYLSFRIAGTDGVSLEAERWKQILNRMGHDVTFIAGELDQKGLLIPLLRFTDPYVYGLHEQVITNNTNYQQVEKEIFALAGQIEGELRLAFRLHKFDMLIVANVLSLPIHFPLAVALTRVIEQFQIPTIARNHDFWWERERYMKAHCIDFFDSFFPPASPTIKHVTINSIAQKELKIRKNLDSIVIGDCFDFNSNLNQLDQFTSNFRNDFNIKSDDIIFLQATRVIPRKKIELAIELLHRLNDQKNVFVVAGYSGDESGSYIDKLKDLVAQTGINARFIGERVKANRGINAGMRFYTLWGCFVNCDFATYPSEFEGFGNQFIEAVYFKKPVYVNRYDVYKADLEPLGFETVAIDGQVTEEAVSKIRDLINNPDKVKQMTENNFQIARDHFSFEATRKKIEQLL